MITRPIVIINGVVRDSADAHVSIADAAFSLGEGILETMLAVDGRIVREARHRARAERVAADHLQALSRRGYDPLQDAGLMDRVHALNQPVSG